MKTNRGDLDEMQTSRRNHIGNQSFLMLFYLLMFDSAIYSSGLRWLAYPANIIAVISVCMIVYLVRVISSHSYISPNAKTPVLRMVIVLTVSVLSAVAGAILLKNYSALPIANNSGDNSALVLLIVSAVGLVVTAIVALITKANNRAE